MGQGGQLPPPPPPRASSLRGICAGQHCVRRPNLLDLRDVSTPRPELATLETAERAIYSTRLLSI